MWQRSSFVPFLGGAIVYLSLASSVDAQILFQDSFSSGANWTVLQSTDALATFGYNYANDAIPQAPNGTDRIGLKLEANIVLPAAGAEIVAVPTNFTPTGNYRFSVDIWGNYAVLGTGTTEFMGAFVGHNGTTPGVNGGGFMYTGDGGALQDVRLYRNSEELWIATRGGTRTPSRQYNPDITTDPMTSMPTCDPELVIGTSIPDCRDTNFTPFFLSKIPGLEDIGLVLDPDDGQGSDQIGPQDAGTLGFQWNTLQIDVYPTSPGPVGATSDLGYATVKLLLHGDARMPNMPPSELLIGTLDNSAGVGPLVNFTQKPAVYYADLFTSVASNPEFNFGLFDNFKVERLQNSVTGDFNNDGSWNCTDINALTAAVSAGSTDLSFDMNGDGMITFADVTAANVGWLAVGGANNPSATGGDPFLVGDATLDGTVDGQDFIAWNTNKFMPGSAWCSGNFNGDNVVDGQDFIEWNSRKFTSSDSLSAVPEPTGIALLAVALLGLFGSRQR